jgi:thiamine-phosphate pyrophosphorylase
MYLPRIQYITHPKETFGDLSWVHRLKDNGIAWIQLRIKEEDFYALHPGKHYLAFFHETADKMRAITSALGLLLTINDMEEVARFCHADGLHIGQEDDIPADWPESLVLGGTANSLAEMQRYDAKLSYFGVGPYRFTSTKAALKPVLGEEGYSSLIASMKQKGDERPVFAIGGIMPADIEGLLNAGVYGIAVSSAIFDKGHSPEAIQEFTKPIEKWDLK